MPVTAPPVAELTAAFAAVTTAESGRTSGSFAIGSRNPTNQFQQPR